MKTLNSRFKLPRSLVALSALRRIFLGPLRLLSVTPVSSSQTNGVRASARLQSGNWTWPEDPTQSRWLHWTRVAQRGLRFGMHQPWFR